MIRFSCLTSSLLIWPSSFMAASSQDCPKVFAMACMFSIWAYM
nr:MAG TPA: hypothetical protein [Inoviridae sp.]